MASSSTFLLFCSLLAVSVVVASAAHSAPAPGTDCTSLVMNLADCLSYVTVGGNAKKPEGTCCSGLKTVLKTDAECLCEGFKNSAQFGVTLNVSKAMTLPAACHLSAPSIGNCAMSTAPGAAPAQSPMVPLTPSPSIGEGPTPGVGTEGAPVPSPGGSGASSLTTSIALVVVAAGIVVSLALS